MLAKSRMFWKVRAMPACGDQVGLGRQDGALVADVALGGDVEAGEAVEEGGLAGAVGADEADDLAAVDGEVDVAYGGEAAEAHGDAAWRRGRCRRGVAGVLVVVVVMVVTPLPCVTPTVRRRGWFGASASSRGIRAGGAGWR